MGEVIEQLMLFGNRLFRAGEAVSLAAGEETARVAVRDLHDISEAEEITVFFNRAVKSAQVNLKNGSTTLYLLDKDNKVLPISARVLGGILQSGNLARAADIIEPGIKIPADILESFKNLANSTPLGAFGKCMQNITHMREMIDTLPKTFQKIVNSTAELERSVILGGKQMEANYNKLLSILKKGGKVGTISFTIAGVISVYELLEKHAQNASGCYRIQSVGGSIKKCKVIQYSVDKQSDNSCRSVHPIKPEKLDAFEKDKCCLRACDDQYLLLSDVERPTVTYQCVHLDVWDAMGDIIGGVANPMKRIFNSHNLVLITIIAIGIYAAVIVVKVTATEIQKKRPKTTMF